MANNKWFRHPWARIFFCFLIVVLDFYIYAEDPILDSRAQSNLPVIGNVVNLLLPPPINDESFRMSTVGRWAVHLCTGVVTTIISILVIRTHGPCPCNVVSCKCDGNMLSYIGKCVALSTPVLFLFIGALNQVRVCMFMARSLTTGVCIALGGVSGTGFRSWLSKNPCCRVIKGERGTWLFCSVGITGMIYLESILFGWLTTNRIFHVHAGMGISNLLFGRIAQCCTWVGDMITIVMVLDSMCQDGRGNNESSPSTSEYPDWGGCMQRKLQRDQKLRFVSIAFFILIGTGVIVAGILKYRLDLTNLYRIPLGETARVFLVCVITAVDLFIIIQDWDFPNFDTFKESGGYFQIGWVVTEEEGEEERKVKKCIRINQKWMQYGPLLIIILLDINMLKNQCMYKPSSFAQYINPRTHEVWTITDLDLIAQAFDPHGVLLNDSLINWNDRELTRPMTVRDLVNPLYDINSGSLYWGDDGFKRGVLVGMLAVGVGGFIWHVVVTNTRKMQLLSVPAGRS
jgi:hypothetical protein